MGGYSEQSAEVSVSHISVHSETQTLHEQIDCEKLVFDHSPSELVKEVTESKPEVLSRGR